MQKLHLVQVSFLNPLIHGLADAGVNVNRLFDEARLDKFDMQNPDAFVPQSRAQAFFEAVARHETGPTPPKEILRKYTLKNMGDFGEQVLGFPDLLTACLGASRPQARHLSSEDLKVEVVGATTRLTDGFSISPGLSKSWVERFTLELMIDSFRAILGQDWAPTRIYTTVEESAKELGFGDDDRIQINAVESFVGFEFPTVLLSTIIRPYAPNGDGFQTYEGCGQDAVARVERILDATQDSTSITLENIARLAGISVRTFQRRLAEEGDSFFGVVDKWRFKSAVRFCERSDLSFTEISQRLHYANISHFSRAFQRWTGKSPSRYRDTLHSG